jgi:FKBP-type peptidyl-prolyl cis-trans isomerase FkpA
MKKAAIAILIASTVGLSACQKQEVDTMSVETIALENDTQKEAYALGSGVGGFFQQKLEEQDELGIEFDREMVVKGFIAGLQGKSQMDQTEIQTLTTAVEAKLAEAKKANAAKAGEENLAKGQAYLAENAKREGVTQTESGLQYEVLTAGEGASPVATDTVKVHYSGTLLDGTEFDSSYSRGQPATFPLNRVISGWTEGVQLMKVGSKYKFHIPANLAYGERTTGKIISNSALIFDVELLEIVSTSDEK